MSGILCSGRSTVGDTARLHTQDELHLPETKQKVIHNHIIRVSQPTASVVHITSFNSFISTLSPFMGLSVHVWYCLYNI
jgi:hypothetical protein